MAAGTTRRMTVTEEVQILTNGATDAAVFSRIYEEGLRGKASEYRWHLKSNCATGGAARAETPYEDYKERILESLGSDYVWQNAHSAARR